MTITTQQLSPGKIKINIIVSPQEYEKHLRATALELSEEINISGFRPGKAPYELVKSHLGEMKLLTEAVKHIVQKSYGQALKDHSIKPVLPPKIEVLKMVPQNDFEYSAEVIIRPKIVLPDLSQIKIDVQEIKIAPEKVNEVLEELRIMRANFTVKNGAVEKGDKVGFDLVVNPEEQGGVFKNQTLIIREKEMDDFPKQLLGLKVGDEKEWTQKFTKNDEPEVSKETKMKVKINQVWQTEKSEINDEFARALNQKFANLAELKESLEKNLRLEQEEREQLRQEEEIIERLLEIVPSLEVAEEIIELEQRNILEEFKTAAINRRLKWETYLSQINKTEEQLKTDFRFSAHKRIILSFIIAQIAEEQKIEPNDEEVDTEVNAILNRYYQPLKQAKHQINIAGLKDEVWQRLINRKVMKYLREKMARG